MHAWPRVGAKCKTCKRARSDGTMEASGVIDGIIQALHETDGMMKGLQKMDA